MKMNPIGSSASLFQNSKPGVPRRGGSAKSQSRVHTMAKNNHEMAYKSSPTIPSGPKVVFQKDLAEDYPDKYAIRLVRP